MEFYNIIFVVFHSNPIGGHLNACHTLHCIRLRYYWPGMYSYIKQLCAACPGCTLANTTKSKSPELVYNFPIEAPFLVFLLTHSRLESTLALMVLRRIWLHAVV